jgi:hypothetical protein
MRLSENAHLPFGRLTALSKVEGLRYPHPLSLRRTSMYASFLEISEALHLDIFHQPLRGRFFDNLNSWLVPIRVFSLAHAPLEAWAKPRPLGCVTIRQNRHSGRAQRFWARPGIQENRGKSNHSGSWLASRSAGPGRDDELQHSLSGHRLFTTSFFSDLMSSSQYPCRGRNQ